MTDGTTECKKLVMSLSAYVTHDGGYEDHTVLSQRWIPVTPSSAFGNPTALSQCNFQTGPTDVSARAGLKHQGSAPVSPSSA